MGVDKQVYKYNIGDLSTFTGKSKQTLYKLIKQNTTFFDAHRQKEQQSVFFDDSAKEWFLNHYKMEKDAGEKSVQEDENQGGTSSSILQKRIEELEAQVAELTEKLKVSEEERRELVKQNSLALLALQQEKQEKLLLLPAPKKTITERIKGLFVSNKTE